MSSSKNVSQKVLLNAVDGTTNPSTVSNPFSVLYQDNAGLIITWTGTLQGLLHVFVTNDLFSPNNPPDPTTWTELDFGTTVAIDPSIQTEGIVINLNQLPFSGLYISYANTTGTGNITAMIVSKRIG